MQVTLSRFSSHQISLIFLYILEKSRIKVDQTFTALGQIPQAKEKELVGDETDYIVPLPRANLAQKFYWANPKIACRLDFGFHSNSDNPSYPEKLAIRPSHRGALASLPQYVHNLPHCCDSEIN